MEINMFDYKVILEYAIIELNMWSIFVALCRHVYVLTTL